MRTRTRESCRDAALVVLVLVLAAGCGEDEADVGPSDTGVADTEDGGGDTLPDGSGTADVGADAAPDASPPPPSFLTCPGQEAYPFDLEVEAGAYASDANAQAVANANYDKTAYNDVFVHPGTPQVLTGRLAVGRLGLQQVALPNETISVWTFDDAAQTWTMVTRTQVDSRGNYEVPLAEPFDAGSHQAYVVFEAARTCYAHNVVVWPPGTQLVLSDIDGTLTMSDDELFAEISDPTYDQQTKGSAVEMIQEWADKGYQMVYLTARPRDFRSMTDAWRLRRGLPAGLSMFASGLVFDDSARQYKGAFIADLLALDWQIVAAYGNAGSDIDGYADGGISKAVTFIIGPEAGTSDTVPIADDDYADHIDTYIAGQPDADQPAGLRSQAQR